MDSRGPLYFDRYGSVPAIPPIPGITLPQVLDSTAALSLEELPSTVTIIGGGVIGMEFAFLYSRLGVRVEVVEFLDRILTMVDKDVSQELVRAAKRAGIVIHTSSRVSAIEETEDGKALVVYEDKKGVHTLVSDKVLAAAGGPEYAVSKFPFAANGKAMTMQETKGFVKLICRKEDGKILGGSIIGPDASALAGVLSLAVSCGLKAEDIAGTVFAHPTTAEAIGEAAMGFGKGMINF